MTKNFKISKLEGQIKQIEQGYKNLEDLLKNQNTYEHFYCDKTLAEKMQEIESLKRKLEHKNQGLMEVDYKDDTTYDPNIRYKCPYCDRKNLKPGGVEIHIGHEHRCSKCLKQGVKKLSWDCLLHQNSHN